MNFQEVLTEVLGITARPDRTNEIISAINAVISQCTLKANFAKDLVETTLTIDPTLYGATIQFDNVVISPPVTRFRKFKYIKPTGARRYLHPISSDKIFTPGSEIQRDRYYVGGDSLTYTLKELTPTLEIGYYQYPLILDIAVNDNHWMLDMMPWVIIDKTCARIFRSIGDDTSAKAYESTGEELYKIGRKDFEDCAVEDVR